MKIYFSGISRPMAFLALIIGLGLCPQAALAQDGTLSGIQFTASADQVVLEWYQIQGELAGGEEIPRLKIYGDGRFEVFYPPTMKKAGLYQGNLNSAEMSDLMSFLAGKGVMDFDRIRLREQKDRLSAQNSAQTGRLSMVADGTTTRIVIRARGWVASDGQVKELPDSRKIIEASNLNLEAQMYPSLKTLTDLAEVEARLADLTLREDLERMEQ